MVLSFHGVEICEEALAQRLSTNGFGTLFQDVIRVAKLGFDVTLGMGARADLLQVTAAKLPLITPVNSFWLPTYGPPGGPHSVVVAGATRTEIAVFDPNRSPAPTLMPLTAFMHAWDKRDFQYAKIRRLPEFEHK